MYEKRDYDVLFARLINALDSTNKRMGNSTSGGTKRARDTASIFRREIAHVLDRDEILLAAAHCVISTPRRPEDVILILLADRLLAVWDIGKLLIKAQVVVLEYTSIEMAEVGWGSGDYEGSVVLEIQGEDVLTLGLTTKDPSKSQFLVEIIGGTRRPLEDKAEFPYPGASAPVTGLDEISAPLSITGLDEIKAVWGSRP